MVEKHDLVLILQPGEYYLKTGTVLQVVEGKVEVQVAVDPASDNTEPVVFLYKEVKTLKEVEDTNVFRDPAGRFIDGFLVGVMFIVGLSTFIGCVYMVVR